MSNNTEIHTLVVSHIRHKDVESLKQLIDRGYTKEQYLATCGYIDCMYNNPESIMRGERLKLLERTQLLLDHNDWGDIYTRDALNEVYYTIHLGYISNLDMESLDNLLSTQLLQKIHVAMVKYYRDDCEQNAYHVLQRFLSFSATISRTYQKALKYSKESERVWILDDDTLINSLSDMRDEEFLDAVRLVNWAVSMVKNTGEDHLFLEGLQHARIQIEQHIQERIGKVKHNEI